MSFGICQTIFRALTVFWQETLKRRQKSHVCLEILPLPVFTFCTSSLSFTPSLSHTHTHTDSQVLDSFINVYWKAMNPRQ